LFKPNSRLFYWYWAVVIAMAIGIIYHLRHEFMRISLFPVLFFMLLTFTAELLPVNLPRGNATISVSFPIIYSSILLFDPAVGTVVASLGSIRWRELQGKVAWQAVIFNRSQVAVCAFTAAIVYQALGGTFGVLGGVSDIIPLSAGGLVYIVTNIVLTTLYLSLLEGVSLLGMWLVNFKWLVTNYLVLIPLAVVVAAIYQIIGAGGVIFFFIPLLVARHSFQLYIEMRDVYISTIRSLVNALEARDQYTFGHSERVARYAVAIGKKLKLPEDQIELLEYVGLLHDIGKIGIRDAILNKPGRFKVEEHQEMRRHAELGADLISGVRMLGRGAGWVRHHHERYDGSGYPDGLKGEEIPLGARIVAVADAYDAMTSSRPYKETKDRKAAIEELRRCSGTQFDPQCVEAFIEVLSEEVEEEQVLPDALPTAQAK